MEEIYISHDQFWTWTLQPCLERVCNGWMDGWMDEWITEMRCARSIQEQMDGWMDY